jgi:phosphoesterase RecJ-like protein
MSLSKTKAKQIDDAISQSHHILLHLHPSPDADSAGSVLALSSYLKSQHKEVTIIKGDSKLPQYLSILPGYENIIDKSIVEIDLTKFDLFISLDASSISQVTKSGDFSFPRTLTVIVIDHHRSNDLFGSINWVDKDSPATSQLVAEYILQHQPSFTYDQAACLLLGLHTDTGGYKYPPTSSKTFALASKLALACPDYHRFIYETENNDEPLRLKLIGLMYSNIKTYFGGKVAISTLNLKQFQKINVSPADIGNIDVANQLKAVVGWEIGITMMEAAKNQIKVSMRKRQNRFDVSKIAVNTGFGGGHVAAAGAVLPYSLPKAKKYLLDIIHQTYPELGEP